MRKLLVLLFAAFAVLGLSACGKKEYEIALVTDVGTINDKSFNQGAWEGVVKYAKEHKISYKYYQPDAKSTDEYVKSIDIAIQNGAKIVVTPGYLFENAIWVAQSKHPDIKFILLDGSPHNVIDWETMATLNNEEENYDIKENTYSIFYAEEEVGFLAGYAAVKEGFTKLGFMGGMSVPAVVRFGYGYVQGANQAAVELGLADGAITIKYDYLNSFAPKDEHQTKAASWYSAGTEVIFSAAGGAGSSVMKAAEQAQGNKYVIGVDVDQKAESKKVITSAAKELKNSVYDTLTAIYDDNKVGGESVTLDAKVLGVGLPDDFSRFTNFTKAQYDAIFTRVQNDEFTIIKDKDEANTDVKVTDLVVPKVTLDVVGAK